MDQKHKYPTEEEVKEAAQKFIEIATEGLYCLTGATELLKEMWQKHHGLK